MHVSIVTAFPEFFSDFLSTSIVGRAVRNGLIRVDIVNLRDFGRGGYRQIDDYAFGTGGMVLAAPQLQDALEAARKGEEKAFVVYPSPQGTLLTQEIVETLARQEHVVILCGHYEGLDERFVEREVDHETTIGDCVLTGGEIPAMTIVDAMSRLVPGVVGRGEAVEEDSFYRGMLDHPHYTRPASWEGLEVPEVLLGGNEADVLAWRRARAVERTLTRRPDLLSRAAVRDYLKGAYFVLLSHGRPSRDRAVCLASLCRFYGLGRPFFVILDPEERRAFAAELPAMGVDPAPRVLGGTARVKEWLSAHDGGESFLSLGVLSKPTGGSFHSLEAKRRCLEHGGPVVFLFPDGDGIEAAWGDEMFRTSLAQSEDRLSLEMRAAASLDRILGMR